MGSLFLSVYQTYLKTHMNNGSWRQKTNPFLLFFVSSRPWTRPASVNDGNHFQTEKKREEYPPTFLTLCESKTITADGQTSLVAL